MGKRILLPAGFFLISLVYCGGSTEIVPSGDGGTGSSSGAGSGSGSSSGTTSSGGSSSGESSSGGSSTSSSSGGSPRGSSDAGDGSARGANDGGRVPVNHRPNDDQCSVPPPPDNCAGGFGDAGGNIMCLQDSDCTAGTNGRCRPVGGPCACFYDTCLQDTDCPTGQTCACRGSPYIAQSGNGCVVGNCRVDTDCGAGSYCSPTGSSCFLGGYYCHTPNDLCLDDSDCVSAGSRFCAYSTTNTRWECTSVGSSCGG